MKHVPRHIFTDNRYGSPQLFSIMASSWNIDVVGTCKANIKGFDSDILNLDKSCERGTIIILCDRRLGIVITRWKDYIIFQTVSIVMFNGAGIVTYRKGSDMDEVTCTHYIMKYQENIYGINRVNQLRVMGAGFSNVAHHS